MFLYGCVATKNIVIAEYSEIDGNYHVVIENFLTRINSSQKFTSLLYKKYYIFSYSKDDMVYLSIASSETTLSNLVYFVKEIKKKWVESYGFNGKGFGRNEKDYEFGGEICILISSFNHNMNNDYQIDMNKLDIQNLNVLNRKDRLIVFKKKNKYEIDSLIFSKGNNRDKTYVLSKAMLIVYIAFALIIIITFSFTILPVLKKKFWKLLKNKTLFHFLTVISAFALISCLLTISLFCVNELFIVIIIISVSILSIMLEVGMMISLNTLKNKTLSGTEIKWNSIDQNNIKDIEKYYNCCGYIKIYEKKDSNLCGSKFWNVSCFSKIQDSINSSILHVSFAGIFIMITNIISLFFKLYVSFND